MQKTRKIIQYVLLGMAGSFVIFVIVTSIIAHVYGLRKVDAFFPHTHYPIAYLDKNALQKITIESVYKNKFNDSVYILQYADSFKITLWIITEDSNVYFTTNNIDTVQQRTMAEDYVSYERLFLYALTLKRKAFSHDLKNIVICFDNCKGIQHLINNRNCQYYYLKAGAIYLKSDGNSYYDIYLGLNNSTYSNFMVYTVNNKLYIFTLYTTKNAKIGSDALQRITNLPLNAKKYENKTYM